VSQQAAAGPGSVAGASGDGGVEYRRGVAAYAVACGLAGVPLSGLAVPVVDAQVSAVALETEDPVDDIRIDFASGWTAQVQAKRTLARGTALTKAVAQWAEAAKGDLDPTVTRLVIATASLNGPMRDLQRVLDRERAGIAGSRTSAERTILEHVEDLLAELTADQRRRALRCAVIWELRAEEPEEPGAQQAMSWLQTVVAGSSPADARRAWEVLTAASGRLARSRAGRDLGGWTEVLRGEGCSVDVSGHTPAARIEATHQALARYAVRLIREGRTMDLRSLGAEIPAFELDKADATVRVGAGDGEATRDLLWAFLRRGRVVVTGLPGSGKTTAVKRLAGQLATAFADDMDGAARPVRGFPLPVRVSLPDVDAMRRDLSFRDRLMDAAVKDERAEERQRLRAELDARLNEGGIALLLDSLDETYERRALVVGEIESFLSSIPAAVCVLVATRDVAYGHAQTLGWPRLQVLAPEDVDRTIEAVLQHAAQFRVAADDGRRSWVAERSAWIESALRGDDVLVQTPLMPILLTLLAIERSPAGLPRTRATVLAAVVQGVVERHELRRRDGRVLGPLSGSSLQTAAMHAFSAEAAVIFEKGGRATKAEVVAAVSRELAAAWSLPWGHAKTAASDVLHMFDESGLFVMLGDDEIVAPRIALFAEIGDALGIISRPADASAWVTERIHGQQLESLVLAASLDGAVAAEAAKALRGSPDDLAVARAMARAVAEGALLEDRDVRAISELLISSVASGSWDAWNDWSTLMSLAVPVELHEAAVAAAERHTSTHALLARVAFRLRTEDPSSLADDPGQLLRLLKVERLPIARQAQGLRPASRGAGTVDDHLVATQLEVSRVLLGRTPDAVEFVAGCAVSAPWRKRGELLELLRERGYDEVACRVEDATGEGARNWKLPPWAADYDDAQYARFLSHVAGDYDAPLSRDQSTRLAELGDFLETMGLRQGAVAYLHEESDDYLDGIIDLTTDLYRFDRAVLAAEARIALARIAAGDGIEPYLALFDTAVQRPRGSWDDVTDVQAAVERLVRMMFRGNGEVDFARRSLMGAPVGHVASEPLRDALPRLVSSTHQRRAAALTLASFGTGPEPATWLDSDDPVLRSVACETFAPTDEQVLDRALRRRVDDSDGHVQVAALHRLFTTRPADLTTVLEAVATRREPEWMCLDCGTVNAPGPSYCENDRCGRTGPGPASTAAQLLAQVTGSR
jgi:hypothetical protein